MKQRVKKIVNWILIALVILIVGFFYAFVRKEVIIYNAGSDIDIYKNHDIIFEIECTQDKFMGVEFCFGANDSPKGEIIYTLKDYSENVIYEDSLKVKSLKKDKHTLLKTDMRKESKGNKFYFVISCDNEPEEMVKVLEGSEVRYVYIDWSLETMIVFCLGSLYLVGLAKVLIWMFRK